MNIFLIGSGAREHALAWKIAQSPLLSTLFASPGNPGIKEHAEIVDVDISNHEAVIEFCKLQTIKLVVVGPEIPLVEGITEPLENAGISVFGPGKIAAQLEGSKSFTKAFCARYSIPTAAYQCFDNSEDAKAYIRKQGVPIVVKADGLAAGKGVTVAMKMADAFAAIDDCFSGIFGPAGSHVIIEDFLEGEEASFFCLCDGKTALPMATAQDHKRLCDGDIGPNTGGMGAYSPAPVMSDKMVMRTMKEIIEPTIEGMKKDAHPFKGVLFAGLMITDKGPKLIEYNVRFGDPECQLLMLRLENDILPLLLAASQGSLKGHSMSWNDKVALNVVLAAKGYPSSPIKGSQIRGIDEITDDNTKIFHAGTIIKQGKLFAHGGRVLNVTAIGDNIIMARNKAYAAVKLIDWPEGFYRNDIGWRAINRTQI